MSKTTDEVIVHWEVDDGYAGASRPQTTCIPLCDWEECEDDEGRDCLVEDYVRDDMEQRISWIIRRIEAPDTEDK